MVSKSILYVKTLILFIIFTTAVIYLTLNANLTLMNTKQLNSIVLFLNDMNQDNRVIEYISLLIIKLLFNVDVHDLLSFFENINPLILE